MQRCSLCLHTSGKHYYVISDMTFCDTCYTKIVRLVTNYVKLKHVRSNPHTDKYIDARDNLMKSLRT